MINQDLVIAKKYAQAFMNVYGDTLNPEILIKLQEFVSFLESRKSILFYMHLSFIPTETITKTLHILLEKYGLSEPFIKLIDVLIAHKRIYLLPALIDRIISLYKEKNNSMDFMIVSSHPLSQERLTQLQKFLELKTNKTIYYKTSIDKRLIAGIKMYSDTLYWEHSIRKQLTGLTPQKN